MAGGILAAHGGGRLRDRAGSLHLAALGEVVGSLPLPRLVLIGMMFIVPDGSLITAVAQHLGSVSSATPGLNRGAHAPAIRVRYIYDADVPQYARDDVRSGVALAASYFWVAFDRTIERPVELDVSLGNVAPWALGYADYHQVHLGVGDAAVPLSSLALQIEVVHELFYVLQGELGEGTGRGSAWLVEGSATYVAGEAQVWNGDVDERAANACWQANVLAQRTLPPLSSLTSETLMISGPGRYDLAALAVADATRSVGAPALRTYFADLASDDWQTAFHQAFGVDAQTFFVRFEALKGTFNASADACDALSGDRRQPHRSPPPSSTGKAGLLRRSQNEAPRQARPFRGLRRSGPRPGVSRVRTARSGWRASRCRRECVVARSSA